MQGREGMASGGFLPQRAGRFAEVGGESEPQMDAGERRWEGFWDNLIVS